MALATLLYLLLTITISAKLWHLGPLIAVVPVVLAGWFLGPRWATILAASLLAFDLILQVWVMGKAAGDVLGSDWHWSGHVMDWFVALAADRVRNTLIELRAGRNQFAGIVGATADAVIAVDNNRRIIHFNESAEAMFG